MIYSKSKKSQVLAESNESNLNEMDRNFVKEGMINFDELETHF